MTTRTMSEMITITNSTRTAAATVSSECRARGQERGTVENLHRFAGGQEGGVAISGIGNLSLLVEKLKGCLAHLGNGQDHLSIIYMHDTTPTLPLDGQGTKFGWEHNSFSKGAPECELEYKD